MYQRGDGIWAWVNGGAYPVHNYLEGAWSPSDQRTKKNIVPLDTDFSKNLIMGTKPKMFEFIFKDGVKQFGMIAQDQEELLKDIGFTDENGLLNKPEDPEEMMSIEYKQFIPHLINVIQDQEKRISELERRLSQ